MRVIIDDGGRAAAGFKGKAGDCVCRANAIVTGRPYTELYKILAAGTGIQRAGKRGKRTTSARNGIAVRRKWSKNYMSQLGFTWVPTMQIGSGCKVHLTDGELPAGRLVVSVSKHYTAVIDGVIHDTFDPQREPETFHWYGKDGKTERVTTSGGRCVYGYWKLENA